MNTKLHRITQTIKSEPLFRKLGKNVYLKLENLQVSGSFKIRGIGRLCEQYAKDGFDYFIASSGGNAGIAVAYSANKLGKQATVVVPKTAVPEVITKLKELNAEVVIYGENISETLQFANQLLEEKPNACHIHPFNHPLIWEGHSTIIEEVEKEKITPDLVICSVGGGGLMCGVIQGLQKSRKLKNTPVLAVETIGADALAESIDRNQLVKLPKVSSIATSLGAIQVAEQAFYWTQNYNIISKRVTDADALSACIHFLNDHKMLVEPACGAALSIFYRYPELLQKYENILCIVCGGNVVSLDLLQKWQQQLSIK